MQAICVENEEIQSDLFSLFSNLNEGHFTIQIEDLQGLGRLFIHSFDGQIIYTKKVISDELLTIENLNLSRAYFIALETASGLSTKKVFVL